MAFDNYFQAFGFEPAFDIDQKALAQSYRQKQQVSHPDRFSHEDISKQRQAVQATAHNNEMYQTLRSSVKRGSYLLALHDIDFDMENYTVDDTSMLIEQLNYREHLNDIKENNDLDKLFDLQSKVTAKQQTIEADLASMFADDITTNATKIKSKLCELRFYDKLADECELVEEHFMTDE